MKTEKPTHWEQLSKFNKLFDRHIDKLILILWAGFALVVVSFAVWLYGFVR